MKVDRDKTARLDRMAQTAMQGDRFRMFLSDPGIVKFLDTYEKDAMGALLKCQPSDDDGRRSAALKINAMRELRNFMSAAIAAGDQASETLKRENT